MNNRNNLFLKYKLLFNIFSLCSYFGLYLHLHWSSNKLYPSSKKIGLQHNNKFNNYTYRIKFIYVNKKNLKNYKYYSKNLFFILLLK